MERDLTGKWRVRQEERWAENGIQRGEKEKDEEEDVYARKDVREPSASAAAAAPSPCTRRAAIRKGARASELDS